MTASTSTTTTVAELTPTISSDKADYAPGSTVTLTGSGFGAGESVHLFVNDTIGQTWQYNADVAADPSGAFTAAFQLPNTFISNYDVTATGATGAKATTTFTDGNATSVSGTVTDSVTHTAISGATVTCDTTSGCNNTFTTTTDGSGNYVFDNSTTKLSFGTNGPVTLTLKVSKSGYANGAITISNVNNGSTFYWRGRSAGAIGADQARVHHRSVEQESLARVWARSRPRLRMRGGTATNVTATTTVNLTTDNGGTGAGAVL